VWDGTRWEPAATELSTHVTGAAMAFDKATSEVVLVGGVDLVREPRREGMYYQQRDHHRTLLWDGSTWREVADAPGRLTGPALGIALARDDDHVVAFGGLTRHAGPTGAQVDTSNFDPATPLGQTLDAAFGFTGETWTWNGSSWQQQIVVNGPSRRAYAAMAYDPDRHETVMFGGINCEYDDEAVAAAYAYFEVARTCRRKGDTWVWSGGAWTQRSPDRAPSPRAGASMAWDARRHRLVLYGGDTGDGRDAHPQVWSWDGATWTREPDFVAPPERSTGAALAQDPHGRLLLFGGHSSTGYFAEDTWLLGIQQTKGQ
jgi:hypothetical protein